MDVAQALAPLALDEVSPCAAERKPMPRVMHKTSRTWEELLTDIDTALSGDEVEIETIKELLNSYVVNVFMLFDESS